MTALEASFGDRYATSSRQVTISAVILAACLIMLLFVISTSLIQDFMGYARQVEARVPTFLIRLFFLIGGLIAAFLMITGTSYYKKNRVAVAPWLFLSIGLVFFAIYVIVPIFQSISYSFTRWDGLYDINGNWTGDSKSSFC